MSAPTTDLKAQPAVMHATIQIKRAATGKVEEHHLTFTPLPAEQQQPAEPKKEPQ